MGFFFDSSSKFVEQKYPNLKGGHRDPIAKKLAGIISGYGWLNSIYEIAKDGIFTKEPYSAVESIEEAKVYDVLTYMSWKTAQGDYKHEYQKLHSKQEERKQKMK